MASRPNIRLLLTALCAGAGLALGLLALSSYLSFDEYLLRLTLWLGS
ncbi:MAG: hypothetical protein KC503_22645 [Myxococcales bacterium]|nr:hypothetical protein [Myxococcales bacterium]